MMQAKKRRVSRTRTIEHTKERMKDGECNVKEREKENNGKMEQVHDIKTNKAMKRENCVNGNGRGLERTKIVEQI